MITNEITCSRCDKHIAWSDTGTLDNIICDSCTDKINTNFTNNIEVQIEDGDFACIKSQKDVDETIEIFVSHGFEYINHGYPIKNYIYAKNGKCGLTNKKPLDCDNEVYLADLTIKE